MRRNPSLGNEGEVQTWPIIFVQLNNVKVLYEGLFIDAKFVNVILECCVPRAK